MLSVGPERGQFTSSVSIAAGWKLWRGWRWESSINLLGDKGESFRLLQYSNMPFSPGAVEGRGLCAEKENLKGTSLLCTSSSAHLLFVGEHYWECLCPWKVCVLTALLASLNGWYAQFPQISSQTFTDFLCCAALTNRDPLSRLILVGIPHLGII